VNNKISTIALVMGLASSLAFAGENKKHNSSSNEAATKSTQTVAYDRATQNDNNPCSSDKKVRQKDEKPSPSQEQQFDEVLRGIYG